MSRGKNKTSVKFAMFAMLVAAFAGKGVDEKTANKRAFHQSFMNGGRGEFITNKHPKMTYGQQNRIAKKRKKARAKASKR